MKRDTRMPDPVGFLGPEERWRVLGAAIVKQAVFDWKEAVDKLSKPIAEKKEKEMSKQKRSAERFISSNMCEFYSGCDGKTLIKKMKEDCI